jgi:uncharacterized protein YdhG (YjbR/CyaY superfamily)
MVEREISNLSARVRFPVPAPEVMQKFENIDEYINNFSPRVQVTLQKLRKVIKENAPDAVEAIAYGMPTFRLNGNLVHFAAYEKHIGFYPAPSGINKFEKELKSFETSKGAIKFPIDKDLPWGLIGKIVEFRVGDNLQKKK